MSIEEVSRSVWSFGRCSSVIVVCEYNRSVVDVYGVLESCKCVIVVCECCGSVINMYGVLKNCESVMWFVSIIEV